MPKLFAITTMLFLLTVRESPAQSSPDGFDPNANGLVRVVVVQPNGQILIGGDFTSVSPNGGAAVARNRIARLNADGTLDESFNPDANNTVFSIAVLSDGKILAGGAFNLIGGETRNSLARLDATSGAADSFHPLFNSDVYSIALQSDGKILVGGNFGSISGQFRNGIARLDGTSGAVDSFDPNANVGAVYSIAVQPDGRILVGGSFINIGGQARNRIARLDAASGASDSFDPNANDLVRSVVLQSDGQILVGGNFTSIGGQTRNRIARVDATSGAADSFNPNASSPVYSIALQADGKILAGGDFFIIGGQSRNSIARLDVTSGAADSFDPNANSTVYSIAAQSAGKILLGGQFTTIGGVTRNRIARLENPAPTPTPTETPALTPTPTPTSAPASISGTVIYCSNPALPPVPSVTMTLTGPAPGSMPTDGSGNYTFSSLTSGGNYTVTPTKAALAPGSAGINTLDVVAAQRQFSSGGTFLTGCRATAADVNGDGGVTTIDVIAIQRFFSGLSTSIANTGKYRFTPASISYPGVGGNQTGQNYNALVFGDSAPSPFVYRPEGPSQDSLGNDMRSAREVPSTVEAVALPEVVVVQGNFTASVRTTAIDAKSNLVGFQGDFTFDERMVTFQSEPVSNAGLTAGHWNVLGNVLAGRGPIRTLRISAYSNDFTPLAGSGTLFELRMRIVPDSALPARSASHSDAGGRTPNSAFPLLWAAPPNDFIFIDADLNTQRPVTATAGSVAGTLDR